MLSMEVDGCQNVLDSNPDQIEVTEQLGLTSGYFSRHLELLRRGDEVLLEDLSRDDAGALDTTAFQEVESPRLFLRGGGVVAIDEDVRVEKATGAHGSRRG